MGKKEFITFRGKKNPRERTRKRKRERKRE